MAAKRVCLKVRSLPWILLIGSELLPSIKKLLWLSSWLYSNQMLNFFFSQILRVGFVILWSVSFCFPSLGNFTGRNESAHFCPEMGRDPQGTSGDLAGRGGKNNGKVGPESHSFYGAFIELLL